ncbi:MAG: 3-oxoacyl-[acyl-carrier protein] reductase, partial [Mycobacterium sp.]|nr:3-oxoacyl-[acyl-carrier protein] reductase [Mycobacterium sp.]
MPTTVPGAFDLSGQVALVTGSSSELGIGFASARLLGQMGASVMVTGTTDRAVKRADELQTEGITASSYTADLMDPDAARELVQATEAAFGKLDILVNNAGLASVNIPERPNRLTVMTDDEWALALRRNVDSAFFVTRGALPGMVKRGYGRIINVASTAGVLTAYTGDVGYHTAKAAMLGMTRSVAVDFAADGVTANVV